MAKLKKQKLEKQRNQSLVGLTPDAANNKYLSRPILNSIRYKIRFYQKIRSNSSPNLYIKFKHEYGKISKKKKEFKTEI